MNIFLLLLLSLSVYVIVIWLFQSDKLIEIHLSFIIELKAWL